MVQSLLSRLFTINRVEAVTAEVATVAAQQEAAAMAVADLVHFFPLAQRHLKLNVLPDLPMARPIQLPVLPMRRRSVPHTLAFPQ